MDDHGLPGEDHPLNFEERRAAGITGRITPEEALGVHRRLALKQYLRSSEGIGGPLELPEALPEDFESKKLVAVRIEQRVMAYCRARAEIEGLTVTSIIESALQSYARGVPVDRLHRS